MPYDKFDWKHQKSLEICLLNNRWFEEEAMPIIKGMVATEGMKKGEIKAFPFSTPKTELKELGWSDVFGFAELAEKFRVPKSHLYAKSDQIANQYKNKAKNLLQQQKNKIQQIVKASLERNQEHISSADLEQIAEPLREFAANYYQKIKEKVANRVAQLEESSTPAMIAQNQSWAVEAEEEDKRRERVTIELPWRDEHAVTSEGELGNDAKGYISTGPGAKADKQEDRAVLASIPNIHPSWNNRIPELLQLTAQTLAVELAKNCPAVVNSGCTGSFLFVHDNKAYAFWVGDSPIIRLTTKNGKTTAEYLNYPHHADTTTNSSYSKAEIERAEQEGGKVVGKRVDGIAVSRAFGDQHTDGVSGVASISVSDVPAEEGVVTKYLLGSDGLNDHLTLAEIAELRDKYPDDKEFTDQCRARASEAAFNYYYTQYKKRFEDDKLKAKNSRGEQEVITEEEKAEIEQSAKIAAQVDIDNTTTVLTDGCSAVFDGHGGHEAAEYASKNVMLIMSNLAQAPAPALRSVSLKDFIKEFQAKISAYPILPDSANTNILREAQSKIMGMFDKIIMYMEMVEKNHEIPAEVFLKNIKQLADKLADWAKKPENARMLACFTEEVRNQLKQMHAIAEYDYPEFAEVLSSGLGEFAVLPLFQQANDCANSIKKLELLQTSLETPLEQEVKELKNQFIKLSNEIWDKPNKPFTRSVLDNDGKIRQPYLQNCHEFLVANPPPAQGNSSPSNSLPPLTFKDDPDYKLREAKFMAVKLISGKQSALFQTGKNKTLLEDTKNNVIEAADISKVVEELNKMAADYEPRYTFRGILNRIANSIRDKTGLGQSFKIGTNTDIEVKDLTQRIQGMRSGG